MIRSTNPKFGSSLEGWDENQKMTAMVSKAGSHLKN